MPEITMAQARKHFREAEARLSASDYQRQEGDMKGAKLEASHARTHALLALAGSGLFGEPDDRDTQIEQQDNQIEQLRQLADDLRAALVQIAAKVGGQAANPPTVVAAAEIAGKLAAERSEAHRLDLLEITRHLQRACGFRDDQVVPDDHKPKMSSILGFIDRIDRARKDAELEETKTRCMAEERRREVERLSRLVGDEAVDAQWAGLSRSDVIALAEEHYAAAEALRVDRSAMWELLKLAARQQRENSEIAIAELGRAERERERLAAELDRVAEQCKEWKSSADAIRSDRDQVLAERDVIAPALVAIRDILTAANSALVPKSAERDLASLDAKITHGTQVRVLPGRGKPHGVGVVTWYTKNVDPAKSEYGVQLADYATATVKHGEFEVVSTDGAGG